MFETAELGRRVSKEAFDQEEPRIHQGLLEAQRTIREIQLPVIIIVSGVEGAGKGGVVNRFNKWFDARGVETRAFWDESDEERERPRFWKFWRALPSRGVVGIFFGSWYTQPIIHQALNSPKAHAFEREMHRIAEFERLLHDDGTHFVKLWFHLAREEQQKELAKEVGARIAAPQLEEYAAHYSRFAQVSQEAIHLTDTGYSPWHIIEGTDRRYRELTAGKTVLSSLDRRLQSYREAGGRERRSAAPIVEPVLPPLAAGSPVTILDRVELEHSLKGKEYQEAIEEEQERLGRLGWEAKRQGRNTVLVFEGWDASGKGGAIRRVTAGLDARLFRIISVAAPTDEERAHHYLWRFWRHLPRAGYLTIYDRSWYGRVLVERVEGYAEDREWRRAYREINAFEAQLVEHGTVLVKFWLHISPEEQLKRFEERQDVEWKRHKITEEDWRNREKWDAYENAVHDMVQRTSTAEAPWTLIPANDKRSARVEVVRTVANRLEEALG